MISEKKIQFYSYFANKETSKKGRKTPKSKGGLTKLLIFSSSPANWRVREKKDYRSEVF